MTPYEKAKQLVGKYLITIRYDSVYNLKWNDPSPSDEGKKDYESDIKDAKKYAIIACDEVIEQERHWINKTGLGSSKFWKEVKKEIQKL